VTEAEPKEQLAVTDQDAPPPPRYVVVRGGTPSDEEIAALTIALMPVAVATGTGSGRRERGSGSGWMLAARHEGVGAPVRVSAPDVDALR
jgi:hypothetical protein